jgi:hypothetical protein
MRWRDELKIKSEIEAIQITDAAKANAAGGVHLETLLRHAAQQTAELGLLVKEILKVIPATGADGVTFKKLSAILAELG